MPRQDSNQSLSLSPRSLRRSVAATAVPPSPRACDLSQKIMNRRDVARILATAVLVTHSGAGLAATGRSPRILLRSSWQTVNIGDIAHTPGLLALIERHIPDAEVWLWPSNIGDGVKEMLAQRFPKLKFAQGDEAIATAFAECDFFLQGSGPWLVSPDSLERWRKQTGKPYGVYGITLPPDKASEREVGLLSDARFVYFRDSASLQLAKNRGVSCPIMEFGPDGAFACDLRNDAKAVKCLEDHELEEGTFLCCIPRYRHPPNWLIPKKKSTFDETKDSLNQRMKEHDHAPLRKAIERVVCETRLKVLICPEDETQMAIGKEMLLDKLSAEARPRVVWRSRFWLTDEALSVFVRSAGLFGNEMHSPIMCVGNGIPAIVCRWDTQTSKGLMWRDIGLGEWLFDFDDEDDVNRMPSVVVAMANDLAGAKAKVSAARAIVRQRQSETMAVLANEIRQP